MKQAKKEKLYKIRKHLNEIWREVHIINADKTEFDTTTWVEDKESRNQR